MAMSRREKKLREDCLVCALCTHEHNLFLECTKLIGVKLKGIELKYDADKMEKKQGTDRESRLAHKTEEKRALTCNI